MKHDFSLTGFFNKGKSPVFEGLYAGCRWQYTVDCGYWSIRVAFSPEIRVSDIVTTTSHGFYTFGPFNPGHRPEEILSKITSVLDTLVAPLVR